jgi:hypothetical protein
MENSVTVAAHGCGADRRSACRRRLLLLFQEGARAQGQPQDRGQEGDDGNPHHQIDPGERTGSGAMA